MQKPIFLLLSITLLSCSQRNVPLALRGTINRIDKHLNDTVKYDFRIAPESVATTKHHFGLGLAVRNGYNLWKGGLLKTFFKLHGIWHADDMSGIILTTYHRKLNGKPIKFKEQKHFYKTYWELAEMGQDTLDIWWETIFPDEASENDKEMYFSHFEPDKEVMGEINAWREHTNGASGSGVTFLARVLSLEGQKLLMRITNLGTPKEGYSLTLQIGDTLSTHPNDVYLIPDTN